MNIFFMVSATITVAGLLIASYTDLKERLVSNKLNYSLLLAGLLLYGVESMYTGSILPFAYSLGGATIAFVFSLFLYKVGAWAGGDVKLFTALGALLPMAPEHLIGSRVPSFYASYPLFPFLIVEDSVLIAFPFIMAYIFWKTFRKRALRDDFKKMGIGVVVKSLVLSANAYGILALLPLAGLPTCS